MKSVELVNLRRNEYNLFVADIDYNCLVLRICMEAAGVEFEQYVNEVLTYVDDIVDDIVFDNKDVLCFILTKENELFVKTIIEKILLEESEKEIVCLLGEEEIHTVKGTTCISMKNALTSLGEILDADIKADIKALSLHNIYRKKYIPVQMSKKIGIILDDYISVIDSDYSNPMEEVVQEIKFIKENKQENDPVILICNDPNKYSEDPVFLEKLEELEIKDKLVMKQSGSSLKSYDAFDRGIDAFFTGLYGNNIESSYTKHMMIHTEELSDKTMYDMSQHNAMNSAIYGVSKEKNMNFTEVGQLASENGFAFSNYLSYKADEKEEEFSVEMNGDATRNVKLIPYSEVDSTEDLSGKVYLQLKTRKDLDALIEDVEYFNHEGYFKSEKMWKYKFTDMCRWEPANCCSLCNLPRMNIKDGKVYPCFGSVKPIGGIEEMHFKLLGNAAMCAEEKQIESECDKCPARSNCSKCAMLPSFISSEEYCNLIKGDLDITSFFKNVAIVKAFFSQGAVSKLNGINLNESQFVTRKNAVEIENVDEIAECRLSKLVVLCKVPGIQSYLVMNLANKKVLSVNINLFVLMELLYKGMSDSFIETYLMKKFDVNQQVVSEFLTESITFLREKGIIQNESI